MKPYSFDDFHENDGAWLICRLDSQIKNEPIDIYMLMNLPAGMVTHFEIVETHLSQEQADILCKQAKNVEKARSAEIKKSRIILAKGDPAEDFLRHSSEKFGMDFESVPAPYLEKLSASLKQSFGQSFFSPSSLGYTHVKDNSSQSDREGAKHLVPDSYDLCSCASGKKYKFCCKKIFREIMMAMTAAEDGKLSEALGWIAQAKEIIGETAEILCREAIIYSFFDHKKSEELLHKCLTVNPHHPRAHYIRGLYLKEKGDLDGAIKAYETAIAHYPASDHYHLNEAYNNLGTIFYTMGEHDKAKSAWEWALVYMPSDETTRRNLTDFIYNDKSIQSSSI